MTDTQRQQLRQRLISQFERALGADPICNGRVGSHTVEWMADEALRACEAVERAVAPRMDGG